MGYTSTYTIPFELLFSSSLRPVANHNSIAYGVDYVHKEYGQPHAERAGSINTERRVKTITPSRETKL